MANGKKDFLIKFLQLFLDQVPLQVQTMQEAVAHVSWPRVNNLAHQLKSNFNTLGITTLYLPIWELETNTRQQNHLSAVPDLLNTIENTVNQAITELQAELARLQIQ